VTGGWRKLHNEEPHNLYSSPDIIGMMESRRMRWAGRVARMEAMKNIGDPEGKRTLRTSRRRWDNNIKTDLIKCSEVVDWIHLAKERDWWRGLVNTLMNLRIP
jgi:hypothetical protein